MIYQFIDSAKLYKLMSQEFKVILFVLICQVLAEMTDGGLDYTFECIGNIHTMVSYRNFYDK